MSSRNPVSRLAALVALALLVTTGCSKVTRSARQGAPEPGRTSTVATASPGTEALKEPEARKSAEGQKLAGVTKDAGTRKDAEAQNQQERQIQVDRLQAAVSTLEEDGYLVRKTRKRAAWRLIAPDLMWKIDPGKRPAEARRIATRLQTSVSPIMGHLVSIEVYGDLKETILLHREAPPQDPLSSGGTNR